MQHQIPQPIIENLQLAATSYADSTATTNAGRILRFIAKIIPVKLVIQLFAHKLSKEKNLN